jgi:hypothetical protein
MFNTRESFVSRSPTQPIEVCCAGLLSSACYGNTVLLQCILCINRLTATCWFDCIQPLQKHRNKAQSRLEMKVCNKAQNEGKIKKKGRN